MTLYPARGSFEDRLVLVYQDLKHFAKSEKLTLHMSGLTRLLLLTTERLFSGRESWCGENIWSTVQFMIHECFSLSCLAMHELFYIMVHACMVFWHVMNLMIMDLEDVV